MKKLFAWIFILICGFSFSGCAAGGTVYEFDDNKPWGYLPNTYEKCTYSVEVIERLKSGNTTVDGQKLGYGEMVYELRQSMQNGNYYLSLMSSFYVTYYDLDENGVNRKLTDTIESEVRFMQDGLGVLYSQKTYTEAVRRKSDDDNAEFADTNSYSVTADYTTLKAVSKKGQEADKTSGALVNPSVYKEEKEFAIKGNDSRYFDNEQLFYTIRALKSTVVGGSAALNVFNTYEIASTITAKGKYSTTAFNYSISSDFLAVTPNESFAADYLTADENGEYLVNCMQVTLGKNDSEPGPSISLLISEPSVTFANSAISVNTSKVIMGMKTVQYDLGRREEATNIVYTLTNYTTNSTSA